MEKTRIVIVGAGYGGVQAAKVLGKKLKKNDSIDITLIDKNPYHTLLTELHEVAGTRVEKESVQVELRKIFSASKVKVVTDNVTGADFDKKVVKAASATYPYDYLILGLGSEPADFGVPGVKTNGFTIWSLNDALKIKEHVEKMFEKASVEKDPSKRRELLTFVVAGAGFTGVETIGELAEWKKRLCREHYIDEKEVRLLLVEAMGKILPMLNDKSIAKAGRKLQKLKVDVMTDSPITNVEKESITLKNGTEIKTNTLIWTCGVQGNSCVNDLGITAAARNRIQTNDFMQSTQYGNVYVVGDGALYQEDGKPLPQIVETALQTAETAAHNIIADMEDKPKKAHKSNYHGIMVSIGSHYAVAELMGMSMSGFIATAMKHLVNVHYLFGVGGFNVVWSYIMHEFFDVKDNRSVIGGHAAKKTPTFWVAILRVYVGIMWLIEGITKVKDGWLVPGNIHIVATDAVSSASQAAEGAAAQAAAAVPAPLLSKPPVLFQWFMDTFIAPHAFLFQSMVVLMEIAIGLALIAGLFTVLASIASVFLSFNFILSAMADKSIIWYIIAGIALCGGAGRAFGLDYYVMPWLKRWWNKTILARKTYLYIDKPTLKV